MLKTLLNLFIKCVSSFEMTLRIPPKIHCFVSDPHAAPPPFSALTLKIIMILIYSKIALMPSADLYSLFLLLSYYYIMYFLKFKSRFHPYDAVTVIKPLSNNPQISSARTYSNSLTYSRGKNVIGSKRGEQMSRGF